MDYQKLWKQLMKFLKKMGNGYIPAPMILYEMTKLEEENTSDEMKKLEKEKLVMKYRISEEMMSQMIFYNVLQCLRKHCVPEEHLGECVVDLSSFTGDICKSESGEPYVQGALICTKNHIEEHEPPIIGILRSTHTIQIAFPKLIPDVMMFIRIDHGAISVDSSGKDPLTDEMSERVAYFGEAVSNCIMDIIPAGSDIFFKEDFYQRLMGMMDKFKDFLATLPDDDDDDTEEDDDELEET